MERGQVMLRWAAAFFVIAVVCAMVGVGTVAAPWATVARVVAAFCLLLFVIVLARSLKRDS